MAPRHWPGSVSMHFISEGCMLSFPRCPFKVPRPHENGGSGWGFSWAPVLGLVVGSWSQTVSSAQSWGGRWEASTEKGDDF